MRKIIIQWILPVVLSAICLPSYAVAILNTHSAFYESTVAVQFHDGEIKKQISQGDLFYAMGNDNHFLHVMYAKKKYKYDEYEHTSYAEVDGRHGRLDFQVGQDGGLYSPGGSFAFEDFSFNWVFDVFFGSALLDLVLLPGTGTSVFSLTNLTSNSVIFSSVTSHFNVIEAYNLNLIQNNRYQLALNMTNTSASDGWENETFLRLNNAIFPLPEPNNLYFFFIATIGFISINRSAKQAFCCVNTLFLRKI